MTSHGDTICTFVRTYIYVSEEPAFDVPSYNARALLAVSLLLPYLFLGLDHLDARR